MCKKLNCWEFKNCGREQGGLLADTLGECPVSTSMKFDGLNNGVGAGRACWLIPNSACAKNRLNNTGRSCFDCPFYKRVKFEEENVPVKEIEVIELNSKTINKVIAE